MVNGPKSMQDLAGLFMLVMVGGAIAIGWLNNRGRRDRGDATSGEGLSSDDGPDHQSWWGSGDADGGHHGDSDGGH